MEDKKSFGEYVAKRRKELGLTQKNFADKLFVSESAVSKWERGLSYPDITLIRDICTVLEINEHELLTASEDVEQRNIEKQAKKFQKIVKTYSWTFYLAYGLSLLACFICNLAIQHTLSWFFIVLTAEMVAFTLTSLPCAFRKEQRRYKRWGRFSSRSVCCCSFAAYTQEGIGSLSLLYPFCLA